jgi:hypothetical protein
VLIPVFAVGRAQEVCLILNSYWDQVGLGGKVPIFFAQGLAEQATNFYKVFNSWTSVDTVRATHREADSSEASKHATNAFDFQHMSVFQKEMHWPLVEEDGQPMVLFATPAMLNGGLALDVFRKWAGDKRNLVVMTGYCVPGTVGHAIVTGQRKNVQIDASTAIDVRCAVRSISFTAHADQDGLVALIRQAAPKNVLLVHGEASKLRAFRRCVARDLHIPCAAPPNGTTVRIDSGQAGSSAALARNEPPRPRWPLGGRLVARSTPRSVDVPGLATDHGATYSWMAGIAEVQAAMPPPKSSIAACAIACQLRWDLVKPPSTVNGAVGSKRPREEEPLNGGDLAGGTTSEKVMSEVVHVFRK